MAKFKPYPAGQGFQNRFSRYQGTAPVTTVNFTKMQGTGNDFILIDGLDGATHSIVKEAKFLCDRRFGIGADQLLLILPSKTADFRMQIINADGSEVEMCGNGVRCFAKYLRDRDLVSGDSVRVETPAGIVTPTIRGEAVAVDMGEPVLRAAEIPVKMEGKIISKPLVVGGKEWTVTCVSMGNPHCVIRVDEVDSIAVESIGPGIETDPLFPSRTNVEFIQIINEREIRMRVWERGAGETLSCGTGACASAVAAALNGWTGREVDVRLKGGDLHIEWLDDNRVVLTGPAEEVFTGQIQLKD